MVLLGLVISGWGLAVASGAEKTDHFDVVLAQADALRTADPEKFSALLAQLANREAELGPDQLEWYWFLRAYRTSYEGDAQQAIAQYQRLFSHARNPLIRFRAALSLVNLYAFRQEWLKGYRFIDYVLTHEKQITDPDIRQQGLLVTAFFFNELGETQSALSTLNKMGEGVTGRNRCLQLGMRLQALVKENSPNLTPEEFEQAIRLCKQQHEYLIAYNVTEHQASHELAQGKVASAIQRINSYLPEVEKNNYDSLRILSYSTLAHAFFQQKKYSDAKQAASRVAQQAMEAPQYTGPLLNSYEVLYRVALIEGQNNMAIEFLQKYIDLLKKHYEENMAKSLAMQTVRFQANEKDNRIALLQNQNHILQLKTTLATEKAQQSRWLLIFLALAAGVLVLWLWHVRRSQQRLRYLSEHDSLTGIYSRGHFIRQVSKSLADLAAREKPASMIVFDLDFFKRINDTFGHHAGDQVLKLATAICQHQLPDSALFGRIGGEEFAVFMPSMKASDAKVLANACRISMAEAKESSEGRNITFTASFGVADTLLTGHVFKTLFSAADRAMYQAKQQGRNRVVVFSPAVKQKSASADKEMFTADGLPPHSSSC